MLVEDGDHLQLRVMMSIISIPLWVSRSQTKASNFWIQKICHFIPSYQSSDTSCKNHMGRSIWKIHLLVCFVSNRNMLLYQSYEVDISWIASIPAPFLKLSGVFRILTNEELTHLDPLFSKSVSEDLGVRYKMWVKYGLYIHHPDRKIILGVLSSGTSAQGLF